MSPTTPNNLPYPVPTDPVAAGADNIKALAQAIRYYIGAATIPANATAAASSVAITFPPIFTATPSFIALSGNPNVSLSYTGVGITGVVLNGLQRDAAGNVTAVALTATRWIAVQV